MMDSLLRDFNLSYCSFINLGKLCVFLQIFMNFTMVIYSLLFTFADLVIHAAMVPNYAFHALYALFQSDFHYLVSI